MLDTANRTFICSVVFIDLVGYSKKPVTEQIRLKTSLTNNLSEAIKDIPTNDRIILDTGDGAAISFLGDPEDALFVTLSLREAMMREGMTATIVEATGEDAVRMGINLGPVKLVKDINGHPNIIGDGINVAQRIMSFARPGQIVVSRSYYDVVSNLASEYAKLFSYEGSRTDKHVREHEIYVVGHHEGALQKAKDGMKDRASATTPNARRAAAKAATGTSTITLAIPAFPFARDKKMLMMIAGGLTLLVLMLSILYMTKRPSNGLHDNAVAAAPDVAKAEPPTAAVSPVRTSTVASDASPEAGAAKADAAKSDAASSDATKGDGAKGDAAKGEARPDTKVLLPSPAPSQIPAAAPAFQPKDAAAKSAKADASRVADATKSEPGKPSAIPATVFLAIDPWGEVFVNGKSQGVSPPRKVLKLDPGKYKIEVRNSTFAPLVQNLEVKSRDETTIKYKFQ